MVLLTEQERLYADEFNVVNGETSPALVAAADWTTEKTYSFTLTKQEIMMLKGIVSVSGGTTRGDGRITIDGFPLWASGGINIGTATTPEMYVLLAAGAHTVNFDCAMWFAGGSQDVHWSFIYVGLLNFNDKLGGAWDSGDVAFANELKTVIDESIVIPTGRNLPIGTLSKYSAFVHVVILDNSAAPTRKTRMKNIGDSNDSGKVNATLWINDAQVNWATRANDDADGGSTNTSYGRGSEGYYFVPVSANQTLDVKVKVSWTGTGNVRCYLTVLLCPWILSPVSTDYSFALLSFSQGSTFYAYLEPLYADVTKASKIGMKRFSSLGDSTDYYSLSSGLGILIHSYTFDVVDVPSSVWAVNPSGNIVCVSYIGVDLR